MDLKSNPEVQAEITALCNLVRALPIGATLAYEAATEAVGRDVQGVARFSLMRAREIVEKQDGIRFGTVSKIGVKRLQTEDIPSIGTQARRRIRRTARRGYARLAGLRVNDITPQIQKQLDTERAALGAISLFTEERAVKKIEADTERVGAELPIGMTLSLFMK